MVEIFLRRKYFYPDDYKKTVFDIDFQKLFDNDIKTLFFDLDNTLIPYDITEPNQKMAELFEKVKALGFSVFIVSNNRKERVKKFANEVKCRYVYSAQKPLKSGFKRALKKIGFPHPEKVCLIGDQFMTDVFGGKRMGFHVIVVDTIKRSSEKWFTRINKHLEHRILKRLKRTDLDFYNRLKLYEKR